MSPISFMHNASQTPIFSAREAIKFSRSVEKGI